MTFYDVADSYYVSYMCVKCKAMSVEVWTGREGSRRLRLPDFQKIAT
jgi:hypothetical protein